MRKDQWKSRTKSDEPDSDVETSNDPLAGENSGGADADPFDSLRDGKTIVETTPSKKTNGHDKSVTFEEDSDDDNDKEVEDKGNANDSAEKLNGDKAESAGNDDEEEGNGDEEDDGGYEVEEIVDHRYKGKKKEYRIRWKGYGENDDSWEKENSLSCPELVAKYLEKFPDERPPKKSPKPKKEKPVKPVQEPTRSTPKRTAAERKSIVESDSGDEKAEKSSKKSGKKAGKSKKQQTEYEVDKIVDHKISDGKTFFRIRWKGYGAKDDTYEPKSSLRCPDKIKAYEKAQKAAVDNTDYVVEKVVGVKIERGVWHYLLKWKGYGENENTWEPEKSVDCKDLIEQFNTMFSSKNGSKKRTAAAAKLTKRGRPKAKKARKQVDSDEEDNDDEEEEEEEEEEDEDPLATEEITDEDNEREWEVLKVVDVRKVKGKTEYKIRWKGCKPKDDTWEPANNVNCPELIAEFNKINKVKKKLK